MNIGRRSESGEEGRATQHGKCTEFLWGLKKKAILGGEESLFEPESSLDREAVRKERIL